MQVPFCIPQFGCERRMEIFPLEDFQLKQLQKVHKPCAGTLLVSDCRSSSSVAEYLILYVLLMVEARFRSDSNWELSWSPTKENGVQAPVFQRSDNSIHWINHYSLDNSMDFLLQANSIGCKAKSTNQINVQSVQWKSSSTEEKTVKLLNSNPVALSARYIYWFLWAVV